MGALFDSIRSANALLDAGISKNSQAQTAQAFQVLVEDILGIQLEYKKEAEEVPLSVQKMLDERQKAKKAKDFSKADHYLNEAKKIAEEKNLIQKSDSGELKKIIEAIVAEQAKAVAEYKAGKQASLQFLIGQAMRMTKGSANPELLRKIFIEILG